MQPLAAESRCSSLCLVYNQGCRGLGGYAVTDGHAQLEAWHGEALRKGWWRDMYWSLLEAKGNGSKGCTA